MLYLVIRCPKLCVDGNHHYLISSRYPWSVQLAPRLRTTDPVIYVAALRNALVGCYWVRIGNFKLNTEYGTNYSIILYRSVMPLSWYWPSLPSRISYSASEEHIAVENNFLRLIYGHSAAPLRKWNLFSATNQFGIDPHVRCSANCKLLCRNRKFM